MGRVAVTRETALHRGTPPTTIPKIALRSLFLAGRASSRRRHPDSAEIARLSVVPTGRLFIEARRCASGLQALGPFAVPLGRPFIEAGSTKPKSR